MSEHPREQLRRQYRDLVAAFTRRFPEDEVPAFPPDEASLNAMVNVNQLLVARLNDREPIVITEKRTPLVVRDPQVKDEDVVA